MERYFSFFPAWTHDLYSLNKTFFYMFGKFFGCNFLLETTKGKVPQPVLVAKISDFLKKLCEEKILNIDPRIIDIMCPVRHGEYTEEDIENLKQGRFKLSKYLLEKQSPNYEDLRDSWERTLENFQNDPMQLTILRFTIEKINEFVKYIITKVDTRSDKYIIKWDDLKEYERLIDDYLGLLFFSINSYKNKIYGKRKTHS